ncbi:unnamed protein product [Rotaria sordida]|uniref:Uncharacterized protein n=1 Tax=Rotaria sordida TaxID=392033 RepID=A0A815HP01_9BILA|nr:unnamed protein product [Rotaria sordida]CAF1006525.1 unnamed protein product [Rotaria sordida]CAF1020038.1 unnamed protein product [Rotaria sordida]CAF1353211.1 unnamed protein product [Rotaria sordida]CAF3917422.1 unnamed protein product [Rotaria sordida]
MVNDHLIILNRLLPNTDQRLDMFVTGASRVEIDSIGGRLSANSGLVLAARTAMIYLPAGTYIFNVGVRSEYELGRLFGGIVTYELSQFDSENQDLGDLKLATFPS